MHSLWKPIIEIFIADLVLVFVWASCVKPVARYYVYLKDSEVEEMEENTKRCRTFIAERGARDESKTATRDAVKVGTRTRDIDR